MITPEQMQSIVDGECSHVARASLLQEIETQPAAWRTLALALLEDQQWSKELIAVSKQRNGGPSEQPNNLPIYQPPMAEEFRGQSRINLNTASNAESVSSQNTFPWLTALAASFLLGVGIYGGSFLPKLSSNVADKPTIAANRTNQAESDDLLSMAINPFDSDMKMLVSGPNIEKSEIPVYDLKEAGHDLFLAREMYEIAKINQRLRREGYELDVRPEYYTGKLNDGRNIVVPVKHVGLRQFGL